MIVPNESDAISERIIGEELFSEAADALVEAYGLNGNEPDVIGMRAAQKHVNRSSDGFLKWAYASLLLEDLIEDDDGFGSKDYKHDEGALSRLFGVTTDEASNLTGGMRTLAFARAKMIESAPYAIVAGDKIDRVSDISSELAETGTIRESDVEFITDESKECWAWFADGVAPSASHFRAIE